MQYQITQNGQQIDFVISADDLSNLTPQGNSGNTSFGGFQQSLRQNEMIQKLKTFYQEHQVELKLCYYGAQITYRLVSTNARPVSPAAQRHFSMYFEKELLPFISDKIKGSFYDPVTQRWRL